MDLKDKKFCLDYLKVLRRPIGTQFNDSLLLEVLNRIDDLDSWCQELSAVAQSYEKIADAIDEKDRLVKADNYLKASLHFNYAQLGVHEDNDEKKEAFYASVRCYQKGAKFLSRTAEPVTFSYGNTELGGYIRKASGASNAPCVIIIRGADASREVEDHIISEYFLQKGFTTFASDFPGQGEARFNGLPMIPNNQKALASAIDYLETRADVDLNRVGVFGTCVGGYLAPVAVAFEKRVKALITLGGFYSLAEFEYPLPPILNLQTDMKITAADWPMRRKDFTMDSIIDKINCPTLVVNGSADKVMPISQTYKIYESLTCPKDLLIYEGYGHNVWYENREVVLDCANWLWDKLLG